MDNATAVAACRSTRYELPRGLTRVEAPNPPPDFITINERMGSCAAWRRHMEDAVAGYMHPDVATMARLHGLDLDEVTAVLSGWAPNRRLEDGGQTWTVLLDEESGDAWTGAEWASGECFPAWTLIDGVWQYKGMPRPDAIVDVIDGGTDR